MRRELIFKRFQDESGSRRAHGLDPLDLVLDQPPEVFGVRHAHTYNIAILAGDSVQLLDFWNTRELRRGARFAKKGLYENKSYKAIFHNSPPG